MRYHLEEHSREDILTILSTDNVYLSNVSKFYLLVVEFPKSIKYFILYKLLKDSDTRRLPLHIIIRNEDLKKYTKPMLVTPVIIHTMLRTSV